MKNLQKFHNNVTLPYQLYNSLFLLLPFEGVSRTGTLLPLFTQSCDKGLKEGKTPDQVIQQFFKDYLPEEKYELRFNYLFQFIQYIERQVVLFDSTEDAAYEHIKELNGRGTFTELKARIRNSNSKEAMIEILQKSSVRVVLTAHPTQFYPGEVLGILTDLDETIKKGDISQIDMLLRQLGKTPFIKKIKPSPYDEAVSLIWYLEHVFYPTLPEIVKNALEIGELNLEDWKNPNLFSIGFWPGGDRDGNPFVTAEITEKIAHRLKNTVLKCYYRDLRLLKRRITFKEVYTILGEIEQKIYNGAYGDGLQGYSTSKEFESDLKTVKKLVINAHNGLFAELIDDLILKVKIYGFHFAKMDIRQHAAKHKLAWQQFHPSIINYTDEKSYIAELLATKNIDFNSLLDEGKNFYQSIECIRNIQPLNGEEGCNRYIISNAGEASNIIEIFSAARIIFKQQEQLNLDIIPLFESNDDLINAAQILENVFQISAYRDHLKYRNNKQTIMLGFSDGTKDGGYFTANWLIYKAKQEITSICERYSISAIFFDGRGGPPARGGGNTYEFYASQGATIASQEIQLTIQGQTISSNFGKKISCRFNLEQLFSALVENQLFPNTNLILNASEIKLLNEFSDKAFEAYDKLKNNSVFIEYLEKATPLKWFAETNVGSRPAKRNLTDSLIFADLRAIPFVSSWAQMKQNIPGYYGIGSAISHFRKTNKLEQLMSLCEKSAFVKTLFSNSTQALAKCNFEVSSWLKESETFAGFYAILVEEFEASKIGIPLLMNQKELMEDNLVSKASVDLREKIVLPMVTIQQYALQMLQSKEITVEDKLNYEHLIVRCMFGIINATRNSA